VITLTKKTNTKKEKQPINPAGSVKIEITLLKPVQEKNEFILANGKKIKDVRELAFALTDMADEIFWHHVNSAKNDFASWVADIYKDEELANSLKSVKDKFNTQLTIFKHIVKKI
jgi:hypothetical protein